MILQLPPVAFIWLAFVALQRLAELALSRAHLRATPGADVAPRAGTRGEWCALVAVHVALIGATALEVALLDRRPPVVVTLVALFAFACAQCLRAWTLVTLGRAWNARAVVAQSNTLVVSGPYRWIRHPNYLAVIIEFSALPLGLGAWITWILINALHAPLLARRIRAEETLLSRVPGWNEALGTKPRFVPHT